MIKKTILPNGIKIISEYMPNTYSATIMLWIDAGSGIEKLELNGISHFIEHMLFKGTINRSAQTIVQSIENTGGSMNAFTDKECTCCYARVLSDQVPVAIDILLDMIFNSLYSPKDIEIERQVILEEIKMYEDTPDELVHDQFIKSFWKNHSLGQPITGTLNTVKEISREDILQFIRDYYTPSNITISIAGNFDEDNVISKISESVEKIHFTPKIKEIKIPESTPDFTVLKKNIEQTHICLGSKSISILDDDRYALAIIDVCLGGSMSSRLFQEIREKRGLVYSINTYESVYRPAGIFGVYAGTSSSNSDEVIKLVWDEMEKIKIEGFVEEEFERAKTQIKGGLLIGLESTKYRASRNGRSELYFNRTFSTEEICAAIDKVTQADIRRLSNQMFDIKATGIAMICPMDYVNKQPVLI
ncbi:MAG: pitrilysin family protein [Candidatus Gastranaerophilales bacterium]|nr:pitrilysin family protein [Candidatus Gastranaerophilales bacterium]